MWSNYFSFPWDQYLVCTIIKNSSANLIVFRNLITRPIHCPVSLGCRIPWLHLCRGVRPPHECPVYDTEQSDGEVPVILGLWGIRNISSLPLLSGPLWPGVVAPDSVVAPINGLNRTNGILMLNGTVWLNWIA